MRQRIRIIIVYLIVSILVGSCLVGSCYTIQHIVKIPPIEEPIYEAVYFAPVDGGSLLENDNEKALLQKKKKKNGYIKRLEEAIKIYNGE
jgi:hypothetical protein